MRLRQIRADEIAIVDRPAAAPGGVGVSFAPRAFLHAAGGAFLLLLALNLVAIAAHFAGNRALYRLSEVFLFYREASFPMLLNFLLLLAVAAALGLGAIRAFGARDPLRRSWLLAACVGLALAYDEAAQFHGALIPVLRAFLRNGQPALLALFGLAVLVTLAVAASLLRFGLRLPPPLRTRAGLAVAVFLLGAVGLEALGGAWPTNDDRETVGFLLLATLEETCEMLGLILFAWATLCHLARPDGRVGLRVDA